MDATKSRALGVAAIATALATLLVLSILCFQDWTRYANAYLKIRGARRILALNETLLDRVRDAETGQRGFLLTGRLAYLEPYQSGVSRVPAEMSELATLLQREPEQSKRFEQLQPLIAEK